jgi:hypothetical protein
MVSTIGDRRVNAVTEFNTITWTLYLYDTEVDMPIPLAIALDGRGNRAPDHRRAVGRPALLRPRSGRQGGQRGQPQVTEE